MPCPLYPQPLAGATALPRPRNEIRPHDWKLSIPQDLAAEVDLLLWDPVMQKPKYGGRSSLIADLLRLWLEAQRAGKTLSVV